MANPHHIVVPERVNFGNYVKLRRSACRELDATPEAALVEVSFDDRSHSGSIGVALMIAIFRYAHSVGRTVKFVDIPADLSNIIEVADLEDALPMEIPPGAAPEAETEAAPEPEPEPEAE